MSTTEQTPALDASEDGGMDCLLALPPHQRSCINLGKVEPCVNKAIQLLHQLREQLEEQTLQTQDSTEPANERGQRVTIATCTDEKDGEIDSTDYGLLCVKGKEIISQGLSHTVAKGEKGKSSGEWRSVIEGALDLVIRMEKDRQDTLHKLGEEKERVRHLNMKLDVESKRRQNLLETKVQAEHEKSMNDLKRLRQCLEKERNLLTEALCGLSIVEAKHSQLKKEEADLLANVSLLKDKIADENFKIDQIAQLQQKTSNEVEGARKTLAKAEDKLMVARKKADAETKQRETKLNIARSKVEKAREELEATTNEVERLQVRISEAEVTLKENKEKTKEYEGSASEKKEELEDITSQVSSLQEECDELAMKKKEIEDRNRFLEVAWKKEREELEQDHKKLISAVAEAEEALQGAKNMREQMEQDNDTMREEIAACKKQQQDDKKALERGNKELVRLDQQLKVSTAQFTKLRDLNHMLSKRFEEEKARTGDVEYNLKMTVETLQKKITEHQSARADLEVKLKTGETQFSKLTKEVEEVKKKLESTTKKNTTEQQRLDQEIEELECEHEKRKEASDKLEQEIACIRGKNDTMTSTMGQKIEELKKSALKYKNDLTEKTEEYEALKVHTDLLQERVQDIDKALVSTTKMKKDILADIERLEVAMEELKEELYRGEEEEKTLRAELKDIVGVVKNFRKEAKCRFLQYTEEREHYLKDIKQRLHSSIAHNSSMAKEYTQLQAEFLAIKSRMVPVLEQHGDVEVASKDIDQLECVQAQLSSLMKTHLSYRSSSYTNKLLSCQAVAKSNDDSLVQLKTDLQSLQLGEEMTLK